MRETVTDYETKVQTVETEEEVVWCDVCGTECTEDHEVVPQELCSTCQPDEGEQTWTMQEYFSAFQGPSTDDSGEMEDMSRVEVATASAFFPLFFGAVCFDWLEGEIDDRGYWFIIGSAGAFFWILFLQAAWKIVM